MEFRHLRYFIAVAEESSFRRASERLHVSQPPLSRQIKQLEQEIGARLLIRTQKGVFLTKSGEVFLNEARMLLAHSEQAFECLGAAKNKERSLITVGIGIGLGARFEMVLKEHAKRFPRVEIQCKDIRSGQQSQALRDRTIDIGLLRVPVEPTHLNSEFLFQEPIVVILPGSSPLGNKRSVRLADIANMPVLIHQRQISCGIYDKFAALFRNSNITPKVMYTQAEGHEEAGLMLVASGKGILLESASVAERSIGKHDVTIVELAEPNAVFDVLMAWRRHETSAPLLKLLDTIREMYRGAPGNIQERLRDRQN